MGTCSVCSKVICEGCVEYKDLRCDECQDTSCFDCRLETCKRDGWCCPGCAAMVAPTLSNEVDKLREEVKELRASGNK